jgi:hypothetical protein
MSSSWLSDTRTGVDTCGICLPGFGLLLAEANQATALRDVATERLSALVAHDIQHGDLIPTVRPDIVRSVEVSDGPMVIETPEKKTKEESYSLWPPRPRMCTVGMLMILSSQSGEYRVMQFPVVGDSLQHSVS